MFTHEEVPFGSGLRDHSYAKLTLVATLPAS